MILTRLDGAAPFFRAHTPKWAGQPLSGAGAAKVGGRLNRPGVHALYLATSIETAVAEYQQLSPLMPPLTLATYHVTLDQVVDFRGGYDPEQWDAIWQDLSCDWRRLAIFERTEPPSWVIADQIIAAGHRGVLFTSQCSDQGFNLVVYPDVLTRTDRLAVHDPDGLLPRSLASWDAPSESTERR